MGRGDTRLSVEELGVGQRQRGGEIAVLMESQDGDDDDDVLSIR